MDGAATAPEQPRAIQPPRRSTQMAATPTIDDAKLEQFMGRFVQDLGAGATAPLVLIGDKLGLYKAMADNEPVTPAGLAARTGCRERYLREWLFQQAASGYVEY